MMESKERSAKLGCYMSRERKTRDVLQERKGKQQGGLRKGFGVCVCVSNKRCYEKPFSIETRVHAKTDEFAAFLGSSFFKIFIAKKTICSSLSLFLILNYSFC